MSTIKEAQITMSPAPENGDSGFPSESRKPPPSWVFSLLMVLVGGLALFSDGYNVQAAAQMNPIFSRLYPQHFTPSIRTGLSNAFLIGEIFGMLFFGWTVDKLGRRRGIIWATVFLVFGVVLTTAAHGKDPTGMFWMMTIGRGVAGFGAGGEYPTCGTSTTEASDETVRVRRRRGLLTGVSTCFAIDLGCVMAGVTVLIVLAAYGFEATEGLWRITFGIGFVLPVVLLGFRMRLVNSTQYHKHAIKKNIPYRLALTRYWKPMVGTSVSWFLYDFVVLPFGIFGSTIIETLNPDNKLVQTIGYGILLNAFYLPGSLLGGLLMDRLGRKQTMTLGFVLAGIMGLILGGALNQILTIFPLFIVLYGIFNSVLDMGPGVATFLCGTESFPTPVRGHFFGFAAAFGKVGAAIGTQVFDPIQRSFDDARKGVQAVFLMSAALAFAGGLVSWVFIPNKDRELEDEDTKFRQYLASRGYHGSFGEKS